ncbi:hypothetical protein ABIE02_004452 [Leclercia sp. 1548]
MFKILKLTEALLKVMTDLVQLLDILQQLTPEWLYW